MHVIYAVTTCSERAYRALFADTPQKPAFQSQKYHRLLIEGLAAHTKVDVVASLPLNRSLMTENKVSLPPEQEGGAAYHYVTAYRNPLRKILSGAWQVYTMVSALAQPDSVVFVDCLNCTTAFFAQLAARKKGCRCVGIITDLPDMLDYNRLYRHLTNKVIARCTDYVLLTEQMNSRVNPDGKPHVILEGHADIAMAKEHPSLSRKRSPRACLYAGSVRKIYGLETLVQGFRLADLPDTQLLIYGPGDYVEELKRINDPRIVYGGMLLSSEIVGKEMEAALLVNPRPTDAEYVKYSFPSKTMEYMASGTPVLTTNLPGMPREYLPYVNLIEEETPQGIADALKKVLAQSDEALMEQGIRARRFVLEQRNNLVQAKKILTMLESTERI